jgi:CRISPR-associated protein Cas5d
LGTREFSCDFRLVEDEDNRAAPLAESRDLGWMLYDMDFADLNNPMPRFFHATMENGVIHVPDWHSEEVRG